MTIARIFFQKGVLKTTRCCELRYSVGSTFGVLPIEVHLRLGGQLLNDLALSENQVRIYIYIVKIHAPRAKPTILYQQ